MSKTHATPRRSTLQKLLGWGVVAVGFLIISHLCWYRLPGLLWRWANEAWWHWIVAVPAYFLLLVAPIFTAFAAGPLITMAGTGDRTRQRCEAVSFVGAIGVASLLLWAFVPGPAWWGRWHWWFWSAALVCCAATCAAARLFSAVQSVEDKKVRRDYSGEWAFNHGDVDSPPALGIAMSGGGIRSAAFNIGVLRALHEQGVLPTVDVMSAVSGGSYAMSWYLLQPFYAAMAAKRGEKRFKLEEVVDEMFRPEGRFQQYLSRDPQVVEVGDLGISVALDVTLGQVLRAATAAEGLVGHYNLSGMGRREYRGRIQRLFHGLPLSASSGQIGNNIGRLERHELSLDGSDFSEVTPVGYRELAAFLRRHRLPCFIFNGAVLVQRSYRHMLWPTAFEFTALDLGSQVCGYRSWDDLRKWEVSEHISDGMSLLEWSRKLRELNREQRKNRWILMANLAPAISGAAIGLSYFDPKKPTRQMKLTTWAPFAGNLDLGYLFPREIWDGNGMLYVSDGGHCENLGAYALVMRQCRRIIIVDAEHEAAIPYVFSGYSKLRQQLKEENQLRLTVPGIDSYLEAALTGASPTGPSPAIMVGGVEPMTAGANTRPLSVVYIKLGLDRDQLGSYPAKVSDYAKANPQFPQDPTSNQAFTTDQFVAYRDLGHHVARNLGAVIAKLSPPSAGAATDMDPCG